MTTTITIPVTVEIHVPIDGVTRNTKIDVLRTALYHIAHDNLDDLWDDEVEDDPIYVTVGPAIVEAT